MPSGAASGSVYLVDAFSLIFQVFHAIPRMSSPSGVPTNALFGFTRDLLFLRNLKPDYLFCAFDRNEPTFRHEAFPEYKGHRAEMPDDLRLQIPNIHRILEALSIPAVSYPRYEADDILATVACAGSALGLDVFLCTNDKDCRQLIDEHVRLYNLRKQQEFGREELLKDWRISPRQVIDLQVLVGDPVDNVPGVPGIGVQTASKLLQEFGTLDAILANIEKVTGAKKQEGLRALSRDLARNRQLVRLETDVPIELDWDAWKLQPIDAAAFLALCREFGFHKFTVGIEDPSRPTNRFTATPMHQEELFPYGANDSSDTVSNNTAPVPLIVGPGREVKYHLVDTPGKFDAFFEELKKQNRIAFDSETTSLQPLVAEIVGLAFSWEEGEAHYLALRGPEGASILPSADTLKKLRTVFENPKVSKVNQNIKYDTLVLRGCGIELKGVAGDPMIADYLLHAGERSHNLEELARRYLNYQVIPITDLIGKKSKKQPQLRMDQVETSRVATYAGEDADIAWQLTGLLESELDKSTGTPLRKLYEELEIPLIDVLAELEANGIRLDVPLLQKLSLDMGREIEEIEKEIYTLAGHPFNIGSLAQLRTVLFDELKLPVQSRTGITGVPSTDQETLEKLAALDIAGSVLPRKILEHRQLSKLKSTYVDALPQMIIPSTGRVHASFNQTVAATGRLSSSDPNLQNIPVRRERGQQIRQAFVPEPGWVLLTADYSQVELRLLAHFCDDETLSQAFAEDRDIHSIVASQIYCVEEKNVTADMRSSAKTVNFGIIYGISSFGLAQQLGINRDEARRFIDAYFTRYSKVQDYQTRLLENCRKTGYVTTILGRRRRFDPGAIRSTSTYQQRNQAEREAINMEIQGSAADLIKLAMLHVYRRMRSEKLRARMLLQIHDELVFETPPDELSILETLLHEEMTTRCEQALNLRVPLRVDLAAGPNWLDVSSEALKVRSPAKSKVRKLLF